MSSPPSPAEGPRVLHVVPAMFGKDGVTGGAERYVLELARTMSGVVPTRLVTFGAEDRLINDGSLALRVIGRTRYIRGQRANPFSLAITSELRGADVVHCHQKHITMSTFLAMSGRFLRKPVFVTDLGGGGWDISSYVNTDRLFTGHLHISEYSRKVFGHEKNRRARVIGGGVDADQFSPDGRERGNRVLFVGRLLPHKGIDVLIRALPTGMNLEIIGKPYDERYHEDLRKLAESKAVVFRYECGDAELIEAYRGASCVVLPSVYTDLYGASTKVPELLGQSLLEGMACGAPAIATDVASLPEIIEDGISGFIVLPNDVEALRGRLQLLATDAALRRSMGDAARARVLEQFRWHSVVERCLEAYGE
ncbi:MAG TPA: glycosyltransferase family 4 protein [Thermoanaerobaculia bacterium]|nr:glycosyltransferase family 4 protein [Thermoanaerobaculia bacterium]